jgi:predicted lipid-binding transport protein (Tim44 family)
MPVWKVLFIGLFACVCLGLALATVVIPMTKTGGEWWAWMGGLLAATACAGTLFALFLRHAGAGIANHR